MKTLKKIVSSQIFIPIAALLLLIIFNLIRDPSFFAITAGRTSAGNLVLNGNIVSIIDYGSELVILAIGMTLVTAATGGQDISVGAGSAICSSVILRVICGTEKQISFIKGGFGAILLAFLVACLAAALFGAFNGMLVAYFKIQPMVATLILFTAGRSIAAWINNNRLPTVTDPRFLIFGGYIPGIPIPTTCIIAIVCIIIMALILKFTNLGLYTQSVGINAESSRLNGLNPELIKFFTFIILGLCVAVVGLIKVSRYGQINYSVTAKDIEMDAILAVALGGNALSGGKFNMLASVLGAYVIQFLTNTLLACRIPSDALSAYKAVVVIILVVVSAPSVRNSISRARKSAKSKNEVKEVA